MLYLSLFNVFLFFRLTAQRLSTRNLWYWIVLAALFIFVAFRFEVGCDWSGYYIQYESMRGGNLATALERRDPVWWTLVHFTHVAGLPYPWLNVFSALVFFGGAHVLARRQPDPLAFLILLFPVLIINMPMSALRQAAAIGLVCVALTSFLDRRLLRFVFWIVLASGFHSSAAIFLLLAPLVRGAYTRNRLALAGLLALPGAYLIASGGDAELAVSRYVDSGRDAFGAAYRAGVLFLSGLLFILFLRREWLRRFFPDYKLASLGAMMMLATLPLVAFSTIIADRLGYYFIPFQAMIFARVPYLTQGQQRRLLTIAPYIGLSLILIVWILTSRHFNQCYVPYQTWLFGFPASFRYIY
jgi:hypothetical protein